MSEHEHEEADLSPVVGAAEIEGAAASTEESPSVDEVTQPSEATPDPATPELESESTDSRTPAPVNETAALPLSENKTDETRSGETHSGDAPDSAEVESSPPPPPARSPASGTILIPAGMSRRPDADDPTDVPSNPETESPSVARPAKRYVTASAVLTPPPRVGSNPPSPQGFIEAARRKEQIALRSKRRKHLLLYGGLGLAIAAVASVIIVVLAARGEQKQEFVAAETAILGKIKSADTNISNQLSKIGASSSSTRLNFSGLLRTIDGSRTQIGALSVPAAPKALALQASRLQNAVDSEDQFLDSLKGLLNTELINANPALMDKLTSDWTSIFPVIDGAFRDVPQLAAPTWPTITSSLNLFASRYTGEIEKIRKTTSALTTLQAYHRRILSIMATFEKRRSELGEFTREHSVVKNYYDATSYQSFLQESSSLRYALVQRLDDMQAPAGMTSAHRAVESVISNSASAVYDASSAGIDTWNSFDCLPDNSGAYYCPIHSSLGEVSDRIREQYDAAKRKWNSAYAAAVSRLSAHI